jgi:hypothetical protein
VEEERPTGFLPPQPAGPEPELGSKPPPPPPQQEVPAPGWQPPQQQQPNVAPPPGPQPPPPGYPAYGWGYPAQPRPEPDNGPAVAGFVLSLVSGALLFLSVGLSSLISLGCAIFGTVYSRRGKRKVEAGETTKNRGLAQAGFIIGIVSLVLSAIATLVWLLILVAALTDDEFRDDLERELDQGDTIRAALQVGAIAGRHLLG